MENAPAGRKRKAPGEANPLAYESKQLYREDDQWKVGSLSLHVLSLQITSSLLFCHCPDILQVFQYERGNGLGSKYYRYQHKVTGKSYHSLRQAVAHGYQPIQ